jgi:hypothetical protein
VKATLIGLGILAAVTIFYVGGCAWWPFANCWCCDGSGRHSRKDGKVFRNCWWCKGTGRRLRIGRRIWNQIRSVQRDAS